MWNKIKGTVGKKELENYYDPSPDSDEEQLMWERRAARLNQMDRYVIVRNPNMGEIEFTVVKKENQDDRYTHNQVFNPNALDEIYENCVEILISRDVPSCRGIYPLKNGDFIAMMAKKIPGENAFDNRFLEVCRGIILEGKELEFFCHQILAEPEGGEKFFFPEDELDPEHMEKWALPSPDVLKEINHHNLNYWLEKLDYKEIIGLASALKAVGKENMKIHLDIPMEQQESMFAALCCISGLIKERLFILLNGECPMCPMGPDILIADAIRFNHNARYSFMTIRINIENEMVTDGQLYFVIENIGTRAVDIQREGLEIVLHQTGHPKRGNIEVANIGRLQRGSLTGGHVALILDTEDTQIEASISICKRDGDKIIVFSSVTRKLCIGQCTNEFSLKSTTRYDVDNAVRGSEILFGRDDIKEELSAIIPKGIAVIYGPSRIGKTSLMNWIQDSYAYDKGNVISISFGAERDNGKYTDYQKNFIDSSKPVPYDDDIAMSEYLLVKTIEAGLGKLSKYTKPSKKQFTKDTRSQIIRILQDESMGILEKYNELNVFLGDEDLELWLMLDEFQQVVERWNIEKTCDFARVCQMISYDRGSNIKLIICGSDDLLRHMVLKYDSVWQDTFSPSCRVVVGPLNPDSFKEMIQAEKTLCGSNIVYSEDAQRALYSYAGGVALYGKEICNTILAEIYAKPTLYSGRHHIYVSDIATKTQELLHTQASSLAAKDSVRIVEIYKAVTKNLDSNSDMQYLWYIAKWINTNPDKEGFAENDFSKEGMLKNPNQMHDSLEIAVERGILRMHVSSKDGQTYYNFRTIFYYYAILGRANKYDKDLIYVNADEDTDVNASKSKVQEIIDSFYTLSDPDDQKKVVGAIYTGLDEDVQEKFRRGVGSRHEGDVIINGDKIGEQHNVHVNVQSITNILNGILAAGTDTSKILSDLQKLPRLSSYFAEAELPKLLENMESEDQEIAYEAEAKIDEKTSQMVSEYRAGLAMSNDISESFSIWNILGISKQEYDWLSKKLDPSFVSDLYFAAKLDSIFAKLDSNKVDSQVKDYSPVSIMYCKVLEKMLKFYHTDVYCERVPRVSTEVKIDGTKVTFGELEDEKTRMLVQNKILLGAFRYPINPEFVDRDPRNLVRLSCGDPDIRTVWKNHGIMLNKVIAIRNDSAHGADGVYIDRNRLNELKKMLFLNEGLLTIVELSK